MFIACRTCLDAKYVFIFVLIGGTTGRNIDDLTRCENKLSRRENNSMFNCFIAAGRLSIVAILLKSVAFIVLYLLFNNLLLRVLENREY